MACVSAAPQFNPLWYRFGEPSAPAWLDDDAWVPPGERMLYSYARTGLYAVLDQLDRGVALVPDYLPRGVMHVFHRLGFDVAYYPVGHDLRLDPAVVRERLADTEPVVAMFVHYLGFADPAFDDLARAATEAGAFVIEDAPRGLFARDQQGKLLGSTGDVAVFSPHKCLPVPNGGLVVSKTLPLPPTERTRAEGKDLLTSVAKTGMQVVGWPGGDSPDPPQFRVIDYTQNPESLPLADGVWPPAAPGRLSQLALERCDPSVYQAERLARYAAFHERLSRIDGIEVTTPAPYEGACPYGVHVYVPGGEAECTAVFTALRERGLAVERFPWPIGVPEADLAAFPDAEPLRLATLVFPTHTQVPAGTVAAVAETIEATLVR
ncbi:DegT/DnrJ/EryC1/StrS family aminotransferase [Halorarius litoreus]|uniref:DegT/DnrJ/EryC1/StrS family aminotransferase n=1 Tax=Halorarius litoreus TaxID=2962676 RepID=UPI0020CFC85A|nr:DegT/DnrJ/EryC1/StrS family aminotransferase [Halorarius litoreus]